MSNKNIHKVLLRSVKLSGGAPKSTFQYLEVLKQEGCSITVMVQEQEESLKKLYKKSFDDLIITDYTSDLFENHKYISAYRQLCSEYKSLKKEKPDLVLILGHFNAFFYTRFCNSLGIPAVTIIAGGDLSKGVHLFEGCPCDHIICFSEENRDVLLQYCDNNKMTVISNRISLKKIFDDAESHYNLSGSNGVRILFTSRISADKYDSVTGFIDVAAKVATKNRKITLTIAGGGDYLDKLKEYVACVNNSFFSVEIKGHVDNLVPEFEKAHIVVGKGRSVIEPIMMNRIGCVMGNDRKIELCTTDNFEKLYHYNFSGRNLNCDNPEDVLRTLIDSVLSGIFDTEEMKAAAELTTRYYSSKYLADKFHAVLDNLECEKKQKKYVSVFWLIIKLVWCKLRQRKENKKKRNG